MSRLLLLLLAVGTVIAGCSPPAATPSSNDEERVQRVFKDFQSAFEAKQAEKMWPHLDATTQAAAEKAATAHREAYAKDGAAEKTAREKKLGLSGEQIGQLSGTSYLVARPFRDKYHDVPEYKIARFNVAGDKATIDLLAEDGDKDKFDLVRSGETWKLVLTVPE